MLIYIRESLRESVSLGYSGTRLIGDMEWAQDDVPGVGELVAYESDVDALLWRANDVDRVRLRPAQSQREPDRRRACSPPHGLR